MNKKAQSNLIVGGIISLLVAVIVGVVGLSVVDNLITDQTTATIDIVNVALTSSNATAVSLAHDDLTANATCNNTPYFTNLVAGTILWSNLHPSNATICNYTYVPDAYIESATTRTILSTNIIMWAVFILVLIAGGIALYLRKTS